MLHFGISKHPKFDHFYGVAEIKWSVRLDENHFFFCIRQNVIVLDWKALANGMLTPDNHQLGLGLFTDVALVLGKALSTQNNPVLKDENRNNAAAFVQLVLNQSSDLSSHIKLAKFRLFINQNWSLKFKKIVEIYISVENAGSEN